jgi:predicted transposase YdaD
MPFAQVVDFGPADGATLGKDTSAKVSLYGVTPIVQRSGAAQATSLLSTASSTAIDTATKAAIIEIMNTLTALGVWKGAA